MITILQMQKKLKSSPTDGRARCRGLSAWLQDRYGAGKRDRAGHGCYCEDEVSLFLYGIPPRNKSQDLVLMFFHHAGDPLPHRRLRARDIRGKGCNRTACLRMLAVLDGQIAPHHFFPGFSGGSLSCAGKHPFPYLAETLSDRFHQEVVLTAKMLIKAPDC